MPEKSNGELVGLQEESARDRDNVTGALGYFDFDRTEPGVICIRLHSLSSLMQFLQEGMV